MTASEALGALRRRTRDPNATAFTDSDGYTLLTHAQRAFNTIVPVSVATATFTWPARVPYVALTAIAANVALVLGIRQDERWLLQASWLDSLRSRTTAWSGGTRARAQMWARLGGTHVVISPTLSHPVTLTVRYATVTPTVAAGGDVLAIPDEMTPPFLDLCEALLYLRARLYQYFPQAVQRFRVTLSAAGAPGLRSHAPVTSPEGGRE